MKSETDNETTSPLPKREYSQEKLALALEAAKVASEMADRLKSLLDSQPLILERAASFAGDGIVRQYARNSLYLARFMADYFDSTDAVDFEEDNRWAEIIERVKVEFPTSEQP